MKITEVKGVSDKRASDFLKLGIDTAEKLIKHFPRNYLDLRNVVPLEKCYNNEMVLTCGKVVTMPRVFDSKRRVKFIKVAVEQGMLGFTAIWFNAQYVLSKLKPNVDYLFYGRVRGDYGGITITNPTFEEVDNNVRLKGIVPVYTVRGNLTQRAVRDCVLNALAKLQVESVIPPSISKKYNLMPLKKAYFDVHAPKDMVEQKKAAERIAIEEYFVLISAFKLIKGDRQQVRINNYACKGADMREFISRFGFEFTDGQKKAVNEIFADLTSARSMNRLLQGDVGSGKTAVALCAIYASVKSGYQAAMLAPTEILAEQNYNIIKRLFPDYECVFLSGSTKAKEKREIKSAIKSGKARIVVGTHAVIQEDVEFYNLSMCVCDEQHRFGVQQRSALLAKGIIPDVLVMSATPIPRTLSLIFYGDLDVTEITDKPKHRQAVSTFVVPERKYEGMLGFIKDTVKSGRQVFCVCPKIDEDDEGTIMSVTELYQNLSSVLGGVRVSLLHGKMKDAEKTAIMQDFKDKKSDLLVSTTVVEVGIDVPNATVMVIYNAERFGLSQLHQLRGRVGRGSDKSYCFLYSSSDDAKAVERLNVLCENTDGFKIAEKDFDMRGSGDFLGTRQSGKFFNELGNLVYSSSVIFFAKRICDETFTSPEFISGIRDIALEKYERLKDVTLN
ncbi:MAG: ATP-dependent DNA helicase RecG [Clostridia bacterium]|nr:ATP-dependent DNA helicase RecG [Clostridia bacterium]